jgi:hypothetical protein
MARAHLQDGYVNKFRPTIRAEHSITDVEIYTFNPSGKRSLLGKMLIKGWVPLLILELSTLQCHGYHS